MNRARPRAVVVPGALRASTFGLSIRCTCFLFFASLGIASPGYPSQRNELLSAATLIEQGRFSEAEELLQGQIESGQDVFSAYLLLGDLELRRGRTFASIRAYRQAEARQPGNGEIHRLLASNYFLLNQRALFKKEIQEARNIDPNDQQAWYLAGRFAYEVEQDFSQAVDSLSHASRLNPDDFRARYYLALSYERLNRTEEARGEFEHACALVESAHSKYTAPCRGLAGIYLQAGKQADAVKCLQRTILFDPNDAEAYYLEAKALLKMGQTNDAIAILKRATSIDPSYAEPQYLLGITYAKIGQPTLSRQALARFRQIQEEYGRN